MTVPDLSLAISSAEEMLLASALRREHEALTSLRGGAERYLAQGDVSYDWGRAACNTEKKLATLDGLVGKLPEWVGKAVRS